MSVAAIILAAGYSQRAGDFKPGLDLAGKPLLQRTIENAQGSCDQIIVVAGHEEDKIRKILQEKPNVMIVKNEHVDRGMFSSVRVGVKDVRTDRFFILPGDQPGVRKSTFKSLLEVSADIVVPRYNGKKGHPVLFDGNCAKEIMALPDTEILRNYIHGKENVLIVDVNDPGIGMDVDTPEDYETMKKYYKNNFAKNE